MRLPLKNKQRFTKEAAGWKAKNAVRLKVNMLVNLGKKQPKIPFKKQQNTTDYVPSNSESKPTPSKSCQNILINTQTHGKGNVTKFRSCFRVTFIEEET